MSVTSDFTLANLRALFNPAKFDIIVRTLVMALECDARQRHAQRCRWLGTWLAIPSGKMKAFFYIAVMLPMWASYIVKAYAWVLLLAKDGVAQWFLGHLGLEGALNALLTVPAIGGNTLSTSGLGRFLVFVYIWLPFSDPAGAGGAGAHSGLLAAGVGRSWRRATTDLPLCGSARWLSLVLPPDRFSPSR